MDPEKSPELEKLAQIAVKDSLWLNTLIDITAENAT